MPITTNGTNITAATFNGTPLTQIIYNGVVVFTSQTNYFTNGTQNVPWTTGYSTGFRGEAYLYNAGMYLTAGLLGSGVNERTLRTTNTVNLTNINTLYFEAAITTTGNAQQFNFIVSTSSTGSSTTFNARTQVLAGFGDTQIYSLDVSGLSGNYFIRIHSRDGSTSSSTGNQGNVFRVYGT
jgi:hypothetical protein